MGPVCPFRSKHINENKSRLETSDSHLLSRGMCWSKQCSVSAWNSKTVPNGLSTPLKLSQCPHYHWHCYVITILYNVTSGTLDNIVVHYVLTQFSRVDITWCFEKVFFSQTKIGKNRCWKSRDLLKVSHKYGVKTLLSSNSALAASKLKLFTVVCVNMAQFIIPPRSKMNTTGDLAFNWKL